MNRKKPNFLEALREAVDNKGIEDSVIVNALCESFKATFNKKFSDELIVNHKNSKNKKPVAKKYDENGNEIKQEKVKLPDALIDCSIELTKGKISLARKWLVVKEDDLEDDFIQISLDDERLQGKKYNVGDFYEEKLDVSDLSKGYIDKFISIYKQKISKIEKENLLETFQGKIGQIVTGEVEKYDEKSCIIKLDKANVTLYRKDLIGKETFKSGDKIKVYVIGINKDDVKGNSTIVCSRSCPQFLEKVLSNEIHEIYDGTVKIYKIARVCGIKSKIAVYSEDPNVDPIGACIGNNGTRIQTVVAMLGNDRANKEKVDVVQYSPSLGIFLKECLKPGKVIGIKFEDTPEGKVAYAICDDKNPDNKGILHNAVAAIGLRGINVILARQLTGLKDINVLDESDAEKRGLTWTPISEFEEQAKELTKVKFREHVVRNADKFNEIQSRIEEVGPTVGDDEDEDLYIEENNNTHEVVTKVQPKIEKKVEEEQVEQKPVEQHVGVKTTTTLDDLEASLEKEKQTKSKSNEPKKKKFQKQEQEEVVAPVIDTKNKMDIYSEEELKELEAEEEFEEEIEENDYSEYDDDDYYEGN